VIGRRDRDPIASLVGGLILEPAKPADMIKYLPFRQSASFLQENQSAAAAAAAAAAKSTGSDDVTARLDALRTYSHSPDGASLVSLHATAYNC